MILIKNTFENQQILMTVSFWPPGHISDLNEIVLLLVNLMSDFDLYDSTYWNKSVSSLVYEK